MKLAYIHGAEQRDQDVSVGELTEGLRRGAARAGIQDLLSGLEIVDIFYGDLLDGLKPAKRFTGATPDRQAMPEAQLTTRCLCCSQGAGFQIYATGQRIVGTPLTLAGWIIDWRVPDVHLYSEHAVLRSAVRERVAQVLASSQPDVVIAHSLGTVIMVDVLAEIHDQVLPRLLVTAGSPLGREGLFAVTTAWRDPHPPQAWLNLIDPTDDVTGGVSLTSPRFPAVWNHQVDNDHFRAGTATGGGSNNHQLTHYLTHPLTAHLLAFMGGHPDCNRRDLESEIKRYTPPVDSA